MNIFNVIVALLVCATVIVVAYWLFQKGIHIVCTHVNKEDIQNCQKKTEPTEQERKKLEAELNKSTIAQRSMDEVIKAANNIMGIATLDEGDTTDDK